MCIRDSDEGCTDVTYENCQARERTQVLMDIANQNGGIVVGTGDLSELALGWATYKMCIRDRNDRGCQGGRRR